MNLRGIGFKGEVRVSFFGDFLDCLFRNSDFCRCNCACRARRVYDDLLGFVRGCLIHDLVSRLIINRRCGGLRSVSGSRCRRVDVRRSCSRRTGCGILRLIGYVVGRYIGTAGVASAKINLRLICRNNPLLIIIYVVYLILSCSI